MKKLATVCNPYTIEQFLSGRLSESEAKKFEAHLSSCVSCREQLELLAGDADWWDDAKRFLLEDEEKDISHAISFLNPSDNPRMLGRFGGYEIARVAN